MKKKFAEYFVEVATLTKKDKERGFKTLADKAMNDPFGEFRGKSTKPTPEQKEQIRKDKVEIAKKEKEKKKAKEAEAEAKAKEEKAINDEMTKRNKERIDSIKIDTNVLKQEVANLMSEYGGLEFEDACDEIINSYRDDLNRKQLEPEIRKYYEKVIDYLLDLEEHEMKGYL